MYADEIRHAVEASSRLTLPTVTALLWRAYGEGKVTDAEAEALSALIEARQLSAAAHRPGQSPNPIRTPATQVVDVPQDHQNRPRTGVGSRPRTDASHERRRRWAASGRLPPSLAARFTLAEQAVLSLVAAEIARRGDCRLSVGHIAALAGVGASTVRNAVREARKLGLLTVEERRQAGWRNDSNVIRIVSPEWTSWLRLTRKRGGFKTVNPTPTQVSNQGKTRTHHVPKSRIAVPNSPSRTASRMAGA